MCVTGGRCVCVCVCVCDCVTGGVCVGGGGVMSSLSQEKQLVFALIFLFHETR